MVDQPPIEPMKKKPLYLLALGAIVMVSPFIIQQFMSIDDRTNGLIRGIGIGMMIVALLFSAKQRRVVRNAA